MKKLAPHKVLMITAIVLLIISNFSYFTMFSQVRELYQSLGSEYGLLTIAPIIFTIYCLVMIVFILLLALSRPFQNIINAEVQKQMIAFFICLLLVGITLAFIIATIYLPLYNVAEILS